MIRGPDHEYDIGCHDRDHAPGAETFRQLYERAFNLPPLSHDRETVDLFTTLYIQSTERAGVIVCAAEDTDGDIVGIAYGYPWYWDERSDPWSDSLWSGLDSGAVDHIEGALAIVTLAVDPDHQGRGLGAALLESVIDASGCDRAWLVTERIESPARRLYESRGWRELGDGPLASDVPTVVLGRSF